MTEPSREFPLGVVLSITTGRLLAEFGLVHEALEFMAGEPVWTHQLPRVARECEQPILTQHPDLSSVVVPDTINSDETAKAFLDGLAPTLGTHRLLHPLAVEDHTCIDPIADMRMHYPNVPILVVEVDRDAD